MRRLAAVTGALAALTVLLAALGALCGAVDGMACDPRLYGAQSREAVAGTLGLEEEDGVTAYIGLDAARQGELAEGIAQGMRQEQAAFDLEPLGESERQHLRDVHALILLARRAARLCTGIAAALAVALAWTGAQLPKRRRVVAAGVLAGLLLIAALAGAAALAVRAAGFEAAFWHLHELLFDNDLWIMNPETDVLIRMMPQRLFEHAAVQTAGQACASLAVTGVLIAAVYTLVGGMIRRNLAERKKA